MNTPVSFELAKLLKEKGYDIDTEANWWVLYEDHNDNYKKGLPVDETKIFYTENDDDLEAAIRIDEESYKMVYHVLSAPTIAEVVMWFYEKLGVWVYVKLGYGHEYVIQSIQVPFKVIYSDGTFKSPTEAYEAGIEYALKKLI